MTSNELEIFKQSILDEVRMMMQATGQVTQYIGARYVPLFADPFEWDSNNEYEPLTIVTHQGNSFTARQFVPRGIDINNTSFWASTGNYNAQIEQYRQEVNSLKATVENEIGQINSSIDTIEKRAYYITPEMYGAKGDGVTDDTAALQSCITAATENIKGKTYPTGFFSNVIPIKLKAAKYLITKPLVCNQSIDISGCGESSILLAGAPMQAMITIDKDDSTLTVNEENTMFAVHISDISFDGNRRKHLIHNALMIHGDNATVENIFFRDIAGTCIRSRTRESYFQNIITRFCGTLSNPVILFDKDSSDGDTPNLNTASNISCVYSFGTTIKVKTGSINSVTGLLIHNFFKNVVSSLSSYYPDGNNTYTGENCYSIDVEGHEITHISNMNCVYNPSPAAIRVGEDATLNINNSHMLGFYNETINTQTFFELNENARVNFYASTMKSGQNNKCVKINSKTAVFNGVNNFERFGTNNHNGSGMNQYFIGEGIKTSSDIPNEAFKISPASIAFEKPEGKNWVDFQFCTMGYNDNIIPALSIGSDQYHSCGYVGIADNSYLKIPVIDDETYPQIDKTISGLLYIHNNQLFVTYNSAEHQITTS